MSAARDRERGLSLVEVVVAVAAFLPLLISVVATVRSATRSLSANDSSAETAESMRRSLQRLSQIVRPALRSTLRTAATQADIERANEEGGPVPALGDWIPIRDGEPRETLQFEAADGTLTMHAAESTPFELRRVLDVREADNGADDDGDGAVDEGNLRLQVESTELTLAGGIERWTCTRTGSVLRMTLTSARRDMDGVVHRATVTQALGLRNP